MSEQATLNMPVVLGNAPLPATKKFTRPQVQNLTGNHHEILYLHAIGLNRQEIAEHTGVTPQTVTNITGSVLGKRQLALFIKDRHASIGDAKAMLKAGQAKAMKTLTSALDLEGGPKDMMTAKDAWNLKLKAAIKLLDKGEHPDKRIEEKRLDVTDNVRNALAEVKEMAKAGQPVNVVEVVEADYVVTDKGGNEVSTLTHESRKAKPDVQVDDGSGAEGGSPDAK